MTKEEKAVVDNWAVRLPQIQDAVTDFKQSVHEELDPVERADIQYHIHMAERLLSEIAFKIPK